MEMLDSETERAERAGRMKRIMKEIGKNLLSYLCLLAPVVVVGAVWFDLTPVIALRTLYGGVPIIAAFILSEYAMLEIGAESGKKEKELETVRKAYQDMRERVIRAGTEQMKPFLLQEIQEELEETRRTACRKLNLDFDVYMAECEGKKKDELTRRFQSRRIGAKVYAINMIKPIELTEDMILCDNPTHRGRGGVGKTGEEYCDSKKGWKNTVWSIASVLLFMGFAFGPVRAFSWPMLMYTLWALIMLLYRMARGYKNGVYAYTVVQVRNYQNRIRYMEKYLERKSDYILTTDVEIKHGTI